MHGHGGQLTVAVEQCDIAYGDTLQMTYGNCDFYRFLGLVAIAARKL